MAQIMGSVNNVQLLPEREGPGKNGAEPLISISVETVSLLCRIPEGVKLCLRQLSEPQPLPSVIDLSAWPELVEVGNQALDLRCYDELLERV